MAPNTALLLLGLALAPLTASAARIPDYVTMCKRDVPDFDKCLLNSIESIRPHLAKDERLKKYLATGKTTTTLFLTERIPKMKIPALEPLVIPALEINRNNEALQVKAKLKDIQAFGGTGFIINRLKTNVDKLAVDASVTIPSLMVTADYDMVGRLLVLPLTGKGIFKGNFTNTKADIKGTGKLIKNKKGVQFIQVKDLTVKLTSGNQKVKIISKGSRDSEALTQTAMNFYNQNKQQVLQIVMPIVEETAAAFIHQFANSILRTVPYSELIPN